MAVEEFADEDFSSRIYQTFYHFAVDQYIYKGSMIIVATSEQDAMQKLCMALEVQSITSANTIEGDLICFNSAVEGVVELENHDGDAVDNFLQPDSMIQRQFGRIKRFKLNRTPRTSSWRIRSIRNTSTLSIQN